MKDTVEIQLTALELGVLLIASGEDVPWLANELRKLDPKLHEPLLDTVRRKLLGAAGRLRNM